MSEYSVHDYGRMIGDEVRTAAFVAALRNAVRPGSVVLDIGTGTGFFATLACQLGARRVYAIESNDAIQVARDVVKANGFADRVVLIQGLSTGVELPERADVIISDLRGVLPLHGHHLPSIADARSRLLAPGGVLIAQRDTLWAAVVEAPEAYEDLGLGQRRKPYDLDMQVAREMDVNGWYRRRLKPEQQLSPAGAWATIDYRQVESPEVHGELSSVASRDGVAHGLAMWFDCELSDDVRLSNGPSEPELVYGSAFFPWPEPTPLAKGEQVHVAFRAQLAGGDYQWRWRTVVRDLTGNAKASYNQSTFFGLPLSLDSLRRGASNHVPTLSPDGRIARLVLERMTGGESLGEIAAALLAEFPGRFATARDALAHVGELSIRYGAAARS